MSKKLFDNQNIDRKLNVYKPAKFVNRNKVDDGCYRIISILDDSMSIHAGANEFELRKKSNSENNYFNISYDSKEQAYTICQRDHMFDYYLYWNSKFTDIKNLNNIPPNPNNSELGEESFWIIKLVEDDTYLIKNKKNSKFVFEIHNYYPNNGTPIKLAKQHFVSSLQKEAQMFKLEKLK